MERKRVLIAFGDIRGFRNWMVRAMNAPEVAGELMDSIYLLFEGFSERTEYYVKFIGDGILIIKELGPGHNCGIARVFMQNIHKLAEDVSEELKKFYPHPEGFRIRETSGHVWKRWTLQNIRGHRLRIPEYIGYAINMAQSFLYIYPEILHICHESNLEIIGKKKDGLIINHLDEPKERRLGIDPQDFQGLWQVQLKPRDETKI